MTACEKVVSFQESLVGCVCVVEMCWRLIASRLSSAFGPRLRLLCIQLNFHRPPTGNYCVLSTLHLLLRCVCIFCSCAESEFAESEFAESEFALFNVEMVGRLGIVDHNQPDDIFTPLCSNLFCSS